MKPGHFVSYVTVFVGAYFCVDQLKGGEGIPLQAAIILLLVNAIVGFYVNFFDVADSGLQQLQYVCRALAPALFTTYLFIDSSILGKLTNFLPAVITAIVALSSFLVEDEITRKRYVDAVMVLNCCAQLYVANQKGQDICLICQSAILTMAYFAYVQARIVMGLYNFAQYNYLSGIFLILLGKKCAS